MIPQNLLPTASGKEKKSGDRQKKQRASAKPEPLPSSAERVTLKLKSRFAIAHMHEFSIRNASRFVILGDVRRMQGNVFVIDQWIAQPAGSEGRTVQHSYCSREVGAAATMEPVQAFRDTSDHMSS
jgi:hypothetical protein